jgi:hypothetical protein
LTRTTYKNKGWTLGKESFQHEDFSLKGLNGQVAVVFIVENTPPPLGEGNANILTDVIGGNIWKREDKRGKTGKK